jgi:hypothetical protein
VPLGHNLESRLTALWDLHLPALSTNANAPLGVVFSASTKQPQKREPGLARTLFVVNALVRPSFSPDADVRRRTRDALYALYRIYWAARLNYRISDKQRTHQGDSKYIIIKQLDFDPKQVPAEFAEAAELAEFVWPLLPALVGLRRAFGTPERIARWWAQFANASFVLWIHSPGPLLVRDVFSLVNEVARKKIYGSARKTAAEDYAADYAETLIRRAKKERFVQRYEPVAVDTIDEAAGKAVAYLITSIRRAVASSAQRADAQHSASTEKRWRKLGFTPKTVSERALVAAEMARRKKHQVAGYLSQAEVARRLKRPRTTVQNAIKKAAAAKAIVLNADGRVAEQDVPKVKRFL